MKKIILLGVLVLGFPLLVFAQGFVGSKACQECHETEYNNFVKFSKKAKSYEHIAKMFPKLKEEEKKECFSCHTTGYGKGGFVSIEKTPQFSDVGCETCHGPGQEHIEAGGDPELIKGKGSLSIENCTSCHINERVQAFNFKPLLYGGVH